MFIDLSAGADFINVSPWPAVLGVAAVGELDVTLENQVDEPFLYTYVKGMRIDLVPTSIHLVDKLRPGKYRLRFTLTGYGPVKNSTDTRFGYPTSARCEFNSQATVNIPGMLLKRTADLPAVALVRMDQLYRLLRIRYTSLASQNRCIASAGRPSFHLQLKSPDHAVR